jgi:3-hydroxyacyl-CoA dehydrogenase
LNEAILTLERGVATAQDIDKTFMLGASFLFILRSGEIPS